MNASTLFAGIIAGSLGTGYFIYGRKQRKVVPMLAGVGLFTVPYLISNLSVLTTVCVILCFLPFLIKST